MKNIREFEGKTPILAEGVYIDPTALVIGDVEIGKNSSVWPMVVIRGDIHSIRIGARTNIQDGSILHITHDSEYAPGGFPLTIGDDVTVGHQVVLHACTIEDRCLIGMSATVLDGAVVRAGAMVGAGSLVPPGKDLEGGYLWLGSPVRRARELTMKENNFLQYSADNYVRLKDRYRT
ncbi:MAG: gamma carbonic anhydrase family protein [Gammaproteobacteria bacterium]|nr:gamma carbonic anhydrase family protein [Gammaproteobacteria bacterium]